MNITLFRGSSGLNTKYDPARHGMSEEAANAAIRPLSESKNVLVTDNARVDMVKGYASVDSTADYRDLFCDGGDALVVKDDVLCVLNEDGSTEDLTSLSNSNTVVYTQTRIKNRIYWTNGYDAGYVENRINYAWTVETPYDDDTKRHYAAVPPRGHLLDFYNGMVFVGADNAVFHSEFGMPGLFWMDEQMFFYQSRLRMMKGLGGGLWVSDSERIYFISDPGGENPSQLLMADYPAIEGTDALIYMDSGPVLYFWSTRGECIGTPSGEFRNITYDKLETEKSPYPLEANKGASVRWGQHLITTFEG